MKMEVVNKLLFIASVFLLVVGLAFLGVSIWGNCATTTPLAAAIGCILLSNLFNLIRQQNIKRRGE